MELSLTLHAQQRCRERGISYAEVFEAVVLGIEILRNQDSFTVRHRKLCVVLNCKSGEVITAFRQPAAKKKAKSKRQHKKKMAMIAKHERKR